MELTVEEVKRRLGVDDPVELAKIGATLMHLHITPKRSQASAENGKKGGRPRTKPVAVEAADAVKRGRGRPKKQDAQTTAQTAANAVRGAQGAETA